MSYVASNLIVATIVALAICKAAELLIPLLWS